MLLKDIRNAVKAGKNYRMLLNIWRKPISRLRVWNL